MPGQRAKNKVHFGAYIDNKLHRKIIAAADKAGWRRNRFGFFLHLLTPIVERRYRRLKARKKAHSALRTTLRRWSGSPLRTPKSALRTSLRPRPLKSKKRPS